MRILYVASEAVPFAKTGGLADVVGSLPKSIRDLGNEAVVMIPRYQGIKVKESVLCSLTIPLGGAFQFCSVSEPEEPTEVRFFLLDYPAYLDRENLYQASNQDYPDHAERFAFLCLAALEFA